MRENFSIANKRSPGGHRGDNIAKICPHCGTKVAQHFLSLVYTRIDFGTRNGFVDYVHMLSKLPSKNSAIQRLDWVRFDSRTKNNPTLGARAGRLLAKSTLKKTPEDEEVRVRYYVKSKYFNQIPITGGMFICKCSRTLQIDGKIIAEYAYSERFGYDTLLSSIRQYIINSKLRRT